MTKRNLQQVTDTAAENPVDEIPPGPGAEQPDPAAQSEQQKRQFPDPFSIALDKIAGAQLLESRRYRQMQIKFDDKPSQAVLATVKAEGFRYNGEDKVWIKQIHQDTAMQTRIDGERLFQKVTGMIRQEKGVIERT